MTYIQEVNTMARSTNDYKALYNGLLHKYDDIAIRIEQINGLAKALSSMVGYEAKKEWIVLVEMIYEKSDV